MRMTDWSGGNFPDHNLPLSLEFSVADRRLIFLSLMWPPWCCTCTTSDPHYAAFTKVSISLVYLLRTIILPSRYSLAFLQVSSMFSMTGTFALSLTCRLTCCQTSLLSVVEYSLRACHTHVKVSYSPDVSSLLTVSLNGIFHCRVEVALATWCVICLLRCLSRDDMPHTQPSFDELDSGRVHSLRTYVLRCRKWCGLGVRPVLAPSTPLNDVLTYITPIYFTACGSLV